MKRPFKWLYPGLKVKRWLLLSLFGMALFLFGILFLIRFTIVVDFFNIMRGFAKGWFFHPQSKIWGSVAALAGLFFIIFGFKKMLDSILNVVVPANPEKLVETLYNHRSLGKGPKIVALGGGTGLPILLRGLKSYTSNLTAIVSMADDGGSSGRLRGELGILPPGDLRNCLIALADREQVMEELLSYRFEQGGTLAGHNVGNLLLAGLAELRGDFNLAVRELSKVLAVKGRVIPATLTPVVLGAELIDGEKICGESKITLSTTTIKRVYLEPEDCVALPEALEAIKEADLIVLGPGSLFTSVIPNLLIKEIRSAVQQASASVVYVCNITTQFGETIDFLASDHVKALQTHGGVDLIDTVLVNTAPFRGRKKKGHDYPKPVAVDLVELQKLGVEIIGEDLVDQFIGTQHDADKLARQLIRLIFWQKEQKDRFRMLELYFQDRFKKLMDS